MYTYDSLHCIKPGQNICILLVTGHNFLARFVSAVVQLDNMSASNSLTNERRERFAISQSNADVNKSRNSGKTGPLVRWQAVSDLI